MRPNITDERIQQTPFGRFANTQDNTAPETENSTDDIQDDTKPEIEYGTQLGEDYEYNPQRNIQKAKRSKKRRKAPVPEPQVQPIWTGQTTAIDIIAPSSVDNGSRDYFCMCSSPIRHFNFKRNCIY